MHERFLDGRMTVKVGDITLEEVDAIVNAANRSLFGGGGVDGAVHARGGPEILAECEKIRETEYPKGLPTGRAVITTGGRLPAKFVIHTVGPIYGQHKGSEGELLADCYRNSLALAADNGVRTIAFPSISTGAFAFPKHEAARIVSRVMAETLGSDSEIDEVRLVFFSESDARAFLSHAELEA